MAVKVCFPRCEVEAVSQIAIEFTGKLLGFDDYVSKCTGKKTFLKATIDICTDMVLIDVTEMCVLYFTARNRRLNLITTDEA